jgi:hypothetical protein
MGGLRRLNVGYPRTFIDADEAQDWLPFGADEDRIGRMAKGDPNTYLEWAHFYNAWEAQGRDVR